MKLEANQTEAEVAAQIAEMAKDAFAHHTASAIGVGEWRCQRPGTGIYAFNVIARPGTLVVYGDLGEWILRMHDRDPVRWARSAVRSPDYLFQKLRAWPDDRQCFYVKDAMAWLRQGEEEQGEDSRYALALAEVEGESWYPHEASHERFIELLYLRDFDDIGTVGVGADASSFWLREALAWFVDHVDAVAETQAGATPVMGVADTLERAEKAR